MAAPLPSGVKKVSPLVLGAFAAVVVLFGVNFVAVRFSNRELAPFWGAGLRFVIASLILFGIVALRRIPLPRGQALAGAALFGALAFGANFALLYWALVYVNAGLTAVVFSLVPLFTLFLAVAVGLERLRWRPVVGALLALVGIGIAFRAQLRIQVPLLPLLAIVGGAMASAGAGVVVKRYPRSHPIAANAVGMAVGAAILLAISLARREAMGLPDITATWSALAWLVFSSCTGFVLMVWVLSRWSTSAVSYAAVLSPLVTIVVAARLAGEGLTALTAIGAAIVLVGTAFGIAPSRAATPPPAAPGDERTSSALPPPAR